MTKKAQVFKKEVDALKAVSITCKEDEHVNEAIFNSLKNVAKYLLTVAEFQEVFYSKVTEY